MLDENDDFGRWYDRERERRERESFLGDNDDTNNRDNNNSDDSYNVNNDVEQGVQDNHEDHENVVWSHWDITHTEMLESART